VDNTEPVQDAAKTDARR